MERDRIGKRFYVGVCTSSCSVGRPQKRWLNTMEYLKKIGLDVRRARRMVQDRSKSRGVCNFVRGNAWGVAQGMNP